MEEIVLVIIGVLSRLLPHPANMTAVGGLALFSGSRFDVKKATLITFITMFLSDMFLGFHSLMWATYGSIFLGILIGRWVGRQKNIHRLFAGIFSSSVIFFLITNFAVWATTPLYQKTFTGFITCYGMAIPFFRNSLIGDIASTVILFFGFQPIFLFWKQRVFPRVLLYVETHKT